MPQEGITFRAKHLNGEREAARSADKTGRKKLKMVERAKNHLNSSIEVTKPEERNMENKLGSTATFMTFQKGRQSRNSIESRSLDAATNRTFNKAVSYAFNRE